MIILKDTFWCFGNKESPSNLGLAEFLNPFVSYIDMLIHISASPTFFNNHNEVVKGSAQQCKVRSYDNKRLQI